MRKVTLKNSDDDFFKKIIFSTVPIAIIFVAIYIFLIVSESNPPNSMKIDPTPSATSVKETYKSPKVASTDVATPQKITIHSENIIVSFDNPEELEDPNIETYIFYSDNPLTPEKGRIQGPSGEETWYNLDMSEVISKMRTIGFDEENYPYWIRGDGVKMLGNYVIVAAHLDTRPKGTILQTSLGLGIVCDTGTFASSNATQIDIAVNW